MLSIHPSLLQRKIIHFDMDAFYASIEVRDDPALKGRPVVVGGPPNSRSVVCTASYEARTYGIRSAMPCSQAFRLCPEAVFIRPDFAKYTAASQQIRKVFQQYTDVIEPLSLDEAFLDVTSNKFGLYAVKIARQIQDEIFATTGLTGSAGVAPNKLLAKIASDMRKPRGLTVVLPEQAQAFMSLLPLRKIHGIGPATERRLGSVGLALCTDVLAFTMAELTARVGSNMASWLYFSSRGIDERSVQATRERKSLGREETFGTDIIDIAALQAELTAISIEVASDLRERRLKGRTITLKVRYADFTRITRSHSLPTAINDADTIRQLSHALLKATDAGHRKIRLLGISVSGFGTSSVA